MRTLVVVLAICLAACQQLTPASVPGPGTAISGTVLERLDGPPYSYLRLKTDGGEVWTAVPMAAVGKGAKVTVKNGAPLKGFTAPGVGRRFEVVVFGVVE